MLQVHVCGAVAVLFALAVSRSDCLQLCTFERHVRVRMTERQAIQQQLGEFTSIERKGENVPSVLVENWLGDGLIDFKTAWSVQRERLEAHLETNATSMAPRDRLILLQHLPVYTLGTASSEDYIINKKTGIETIRMDRGGEVTFHGPGQLVVYPVLNLRQSFVPDLHRYLRSLEQSVILSLHQLGIPAVRDENFSGVWVDKYKVAAVGVKCRQWISQHGIAINVEKQSLHGFSAIVPCGLDGRLVGCVNDFLDKPVSVSEFADIFVPNFESAFSVSCFLPKQNQGN